MNWHQQEITYIDFKGQNRLIGMFWVDDNGNVDPDNLPSSYDLCDLLKALKYRPQGLSIEATGMSVEE